MFMYCFTMLDLLTTTITYCTVFVSHRETDMRNSILAQVLDQSARARCKFIYLCLKLAGLGLPAYCFQLSFRWDYSL